MKLVVALTNNPPLHSIPTPGTILNVKGLPFSSPRSICLSGATTTEFNATLEQAASRRMHRELSSLKHILEV
jgi:hypothetical protein